MEYVQGAKVIIHVQTNKQFSVIELEMQYGETYLEFAKRVEQKMKSLN